MAARYSTYTPRHDGAQPANHSDPDLARSARAQLRRAKEAARYRAHEFTILATTHSERASPGIGDRQGEMV